jgi:SAM-dependent methyltransferase
MTGSGDVRNDVPNGVPNFDRLARPYRWLEYLSFGPLLWRCRICFLAEIAGCRSALVLGDGDGRFTAHLLQSNPDIQVTAIDGSVRMIKSLQRAATTNRDRLTTQVADLRTWSPDAQYGFDLIVSHFFLDCLTSDEVAAIAERIAPALAHDALWLISEFAIPDTIFGRIVAAPIVWSLYLAFRVLTGLSVNSLPDHAEALKASGWKLNLEKEHLSGLLTSQLWQHASGQTAESVPEFD